MTKIRKSEATGRNTRKVGNYSFGPRRLKNLKQNVLCNSHRKRERVDTCV